MIPKTETAMRAYVETYGCQMNISDGELMQGILETEGYVLVSAPEEADVILVNTCAIRDHAERRVLGRVSQLNGLRKDRPDLVLGVTGCMAQRMGTALLEQAPYVDLVLGPDGYRGLGDRLRAVRSGETVPAQDPSIPVRGAPDGSARVAAGAGVHVRPAPKPTAGRSPLLPVARNRVQLAVLELDPRENYEGLEQRRASGVAAWVPIQRGCDHRCTYCIVPYVRGPEKNRDLQEILREIRGLAESGVSEVTLLGQTVNSWAQGETRFPQLLREVARVDGIERVRFTSPHPNDVTPELIEVMATEPSVCEHLHLPVQSGNDRILKRMVRRYDLASYLEKVEWVRSAIPDIALSTDVIVAFPGETDAEYEDTLALMRSVRFDEAYTYRYSPREGTPATRLPPEEAIPDAVAQARLERLIELARGIQLEINRSELGRIETVLVEKEARDPGSLMGRTRRNKGVVFPFDGVWAPGDRFRVELTSTTGPTFRGGVRV
jgi:tRNA-2-methylthio-N6-dimethylallyladenosine synthase